MENKSEIERVTISNAGMNALEEIRGLSEKAQYLLICGQKKDKHGRWYLEGTEDAFDALARDVNEEIMYELSPKSKLPALRAVYKRIAPQYDEF